MSTGPQPELHFSHPRHSEAAAHTKAEQLYARTSMTYLGGMVALVAGAIGLLLSWSVDNSWSLGCGIFFTSVVAGIFVSRTSSLDACFSSGVSNVVLALLVPVADLQMLLPLWVVGTFLGRWVACTNLRRCVRATIDAAVSGAVFVAVIVASFRALSGTVPDGTDVFVTMSWFWSVLLALVAAVTVQIAMSIVRTSLAHTSTVSQALTAIGWPRLLFLSGLTLVASTAGGVLSVHLGAAFPHYVDPVWQEAVAAFTSLSAFSVASLIQTTASNRRATALTRALGESFNGLSESQIVNRILSWTTQAMPAFIVTLQPTYGGQETKPLSPGNVLQSEPINSAFGSFRLRAQRTALQRPFSTGDAETLNALCTLIKDKLQTMQTVNRLADQANTDPLTGLLNYRGFRRVVSSIDRARVIRGSADSNGTAVIFMDLDGFKHVNDTHGHEVGNTVLREVATRIGAGTRHPDVAARIGGDEFVVVLRSVASRKKAHEVAEQLAQAVRAPIRLDHGWVTVGVSTGIAFSQPAENNPLSATDLLMMADQRMYDVKRTKLLGEDYPHEQPHSSGRDRACERTQAIKRMVEEQRLRVVYQPIVDSNTGEIHAIEALVRPGSNVPQCSATELVEIARSNGLMKSLTEFVLDVAVSDFSAFAASCPTLHQLFVNIHAEEIFAPGFLADYEKWQAHVPPDSLVLEVNEHWVSHWDSTVAETLNRRISEHRLRLAVDDFGHSDTALMAVLALPLDVVKVDKSVIDAYHSPRAAVVISGLTSMAQAMGIRLVFEGVETTEQLSFLRAHGGRMVQGFVYSPPVSRPDLEHLLAGPLTPVTYGLRPPADPARNSAEPPDSPERGSRPPSQG